MQLYIQMCTHIYTHTYIDTRISHSCSRRSSLEIRCSSSTFEAASWSKPPPLPGGVSLLGGFQTTNPQEQDPPWKKKPNFSKNWGSYSGRVLFLQALHVEPTYIYVHTYAHVYILTHTYAYICIYTYISQWQWADRFFWLTVAVSCICWRDAIDVPAEEHAHDSAAHFKKKKKDSSHVQYSYNKTFFFFLTVAVSCICWRGAIDVPAEEHAHDSSAHWAPISSENCDSSSCVYICIYI